MMWLVWVVIACLNLTLNTARCEEDAELALPLSFLNHRSSFGPDSSDDSSVALGGSSLRPLPCVTTWTYLIGRTLVNLAALGLSVGGIFDRTLVPAGAASHGVSALMHAHGILYPWHFVNLGDEGADLATFFRYLHLQSALGLAAHESAFILSVCASFNGDHSLTIATGVVAILAALIDGWGLYTSIRPRNTLGDFA